MMAMSDRKSVKFSEEVYQKLQEVKSDHETWDHFGLRVANELDEPDF